MEYAEDTRDRLRREIDLCDEGIADCNEKMTLLFSEIDELTGMREAFERTKEDYEIHLEEQERQFG